MTICGILNSGIILKTFTHVYVVAHEVLKGCKNQVSLKACFANVNISKRMIKIINVLNFQTLVACQKSIMETLIRLLLQKPSLFAIEYSDKHFVIYSPDNPHFICDYEKKSVQNLRTCTVSFK